VVISGKTWIVAYSSANCFCSLAAETAVRMVNIIVGDIDGGHLPKSGNRDAKLVIAYRTVPNSLRTSTLLMGGQDVSRAEISRIKVSAADVQQG
jgi:hypothetical protein